MTPKQIASKLDMLKTRQAKLRDQMRELLDEIEENCSNADEAIAALEDAADAVSRLV